MKENEIKDGITRTVNGLEQKAIISLRALRLGESDNYFADARVLPWSLVFEGAKA